MNRDLILPPTLFFRRDFCYYISDIDARNYNPALSTGRSAGKNNSGVFLDVLLVGKFLLFPFAQGVCVLPDTSRSVVDFR